MVTVGGAIRSSLVTNNVLSLFSQEAEKLTKAMKNEEFRKLLTEYAQEINNPENRAVIRKKTRSQTTPCAQTEFPTIFIPVQTYAHGEQWCW